MTLQADFESHHIEGFAVAALKAGATDEEAFFSVPLISHIKDNLWSGGCINGVKLDDSFDYVISLYPWEKYKLGPNTKRIEIKMYDAAHMPEEDLDQLTQEVAALVRKGKTLVHCQAGLNRSGLLSTLVLMDQGMSAEDAIALLREKRSPMVLCNTTFEQWLLARD